MSTWTHVSGVIRIDSIRGLGEPMSLYRILSDFQNMSPPTGSEGGLLITGYEDPNISSIASFVITIHGDLRDYSNIEEVVEWLERVIRINRLDVRQGICEIEVGGIKKHLWNYTLPKADNINNKRSYKMVGLGLDATNEHRGTAVQIYQEANYPYEWFVREAKEFKLKFNLEE